MHPETYAVIEALEAQKKFSKWHDSLESAQSEAKRLAVNNPGKRFIVVKAIGYAVKSDVVWIDL